MHPEHPSKHYILHIFNAFIIFYYPTPFTHWCSFPQTYNHYDAMPAQWDCPINSRGTRAKRCGRGYPEGVILSKGQGWWAQRNLPWMTTFTTESYPLGGCTCLRSPRHFTIDTHFCKCVNYYDVMSRMVTCDAFDSTQRESTTPKGVAFHTPRSPG